MIMNKKQQTDLTNGPIVQNSGKAGFAYYGFLLSGNSLQHHRYGMDRCSWFQGSGRCGNGGMYVWLSQGLCSLARMGGQVNVAQSCGRGDTKAARDLRLCGPFSLPVFFAFFVFCSVPDSLPGRFWIFFHLGDPQTYAHAEIYMKITCGLVIFFLP